MCVRSTPHATHRLLVDEKIDVSSVFSGHPDLVVLPGSFSSRIVSLISHLLSTYLFYHLYSSIIRVTMTHIHRHDDAFSSASSHLGKIYRTPRSGAYSRDRALSRPCKFGYREPRVFATPRKKIDGEQTEGCWKHRARQSERRSWAAAVAATSTTGYGGSRAGVTWPLALACGEGKTISSREKRYPP